MCTSFILKTEDGSPVFARTLEWGLFDTKSELVMNPRNFTLTSKLDGGKQGKTWKAKYGFVAINFSHMDCYMDGMNEAGLAMGVFYLPGFAKYQPLKSGEESSTINNAELITYILGNFKTVKEVKAALPEIRVVYSEDFAKKLGAPLALHYVATDSAGDSIVIEYVDTKLNIYDNTIGVMTNAPTYDWHLMNLRNYTQLTPYADGPGDKKIGGVDFTPFGLGAGMTGLPGDYSPASRFIRAFFYVQTSVPLKDTDAAVNQASRILNNFDIPKGIARSGTPDNYGFDYTQWSVISDTRNKRYHWWTEWNRQMRMVDLNQLSFDGDKVVAIPLDKERVENIDDRSGDFLC
jgi:choloylglycine hydrolase